MKEYQCWEQKNRSGLLRIEAWAAEILRVRYTKKGNFLPFDWALSDWASTSYPSPALSPKAVYDPEKRLFSTPTIQVHIEEINHHQKDRLVFRNGAGRTLLEEVESPRAYAKLGHELHARAGDSFQATARFKAQDGERFWGTGQHQINSLDLKGCCIDLAQKNTEVAVPFVISSRGYGLFWNNPAIGRAQFGYNETLWLAEETDQLDYFVIAGESPKEILRHYFSLTGHPAELPSWATGFWQCKLRYHEQEQVLGIAREYKRRGLPLSMIVIDFFHWQHMGDWGFDPVKWPNPEGMLAELKRLGVECMISVWPAVNSASSNYQALAENGYLLETMSGIHAMQDFTDTYEKSGKFLCYYDASNSEARNFVWEQIQKNYFDIGIRHYWLDACEPELTNYPYSSIRYSIGNGQKYSSLYPLLHEKGFYEHARAEGQERPLNLCRSAWAGSQKYGALVWSGDIDSTFAALEIQIKSGLNMAMSGIPWWTTDIGGFYGGRGSDAEFRELLIRWFQYAVFTPVLRLHGLREIEETGGQQAELGAITGGANEIWSFGDEVYNIIKEQLFLREGLRPMLNDLFRSAAKDGKLIMRPLCYDFFADPNALAIEDQFMCGEHILVAPIYRYQERERRVYLPEGHSWKHLFTQQVFQGGWVTCPAPLEHIPVFLRDGFTI